MRLCKYQQPLKIHNCRTVQSEHDTYQKGNEIIEKTLPGLRWVATMLITAINRYNDLSGMPLSCSSRSSLKTELHSNLDGAVEVNVCADSVMLVIGPLTGTTLLPYSETREVPSRRHRPHFQSFCSWNCQKNCSFAKDNWFDPNLNLRIVFKVTAESLANDEVSSYYEFSLHKIHKNQVGVHDINALFFALKTANYVAIPIRK